VQSFVWWCCGQLEQSEQSARRARAIAEQIHDEYHAALAAWYLSVALADRAEPEKQAEAEECAWVMILSGDNPLFEAVARNVSARVALARGDWERAEKEARASRAGLISMPPYGTMSAAYLLWALAAQGRWEEACALAREELARLARLEGPLCTEVLLRVAAADVFLGGGYHAEGESALASALGEIALRAGKIGDPELRAAYLSQRHENRRAAELGAALGLAPGELG
jgi:hypothetical protein